MTIPKFDEGRSTAIREGLMQLARPTPSRRPWMGVAAIALASALTGGAVSAAVAVGLNPPISNPAPIPNPDGSVAAGNPGVAAPAGVQPGAPIISLLGSSVSQNVAGRVAIPLNHPAAATHVRATVTCLTAGSISWGPDAGGNNPSSGCAATDSVEQRTSWMDFALSDGDVLYVDSGDGAEAIVSLQFVNQVETAWGVNARGETFGVSKPGFGEPDLLAVVATNDKPGYVNRGELADADGTTAAESFDSPGDALAWQESMKGKRISIPVYESDGVTVVGEFVIQY